MVGIDMHLKRLFKFDLFHQIAFWGANSRRNFCCSSFLVLYLYIEAHETLDLVLSHILCVKAWGLYIPFSLIQKMLWKNRRVPVFDNRNTNQCLHSSHYINVYLHIIVPRWTHFDVFGITTEYGWRRVDQKWSGGNTKWLQHLSGCLWKNTRQRQWPPEVGLAHFLVPNIGKDSEWLWPYSVTKHWPSATGYLAW